jgi:hypothetical protein
LLKIEQNKAMGKPKKSIDGDFLPYWIIKLDAHFGRNLKSN